ncbi:flagellar hook-length control protein FliK [Pseudomonas tohonis]|uniref:Flagellar hook-length control protein FliK n=1 Tax=Pseudomonas tohonis TaxID=2725477 RepID=A0A6J4E7G8_9PSED|nr:flagellar hook-length control protein FliK [Pseudomonas tohonis]BCG25727.1 flagellar hook-length control protein FliK [Pseudomonas tohonis]
MPVATDMLLQASPDVKPKVQAAKAQVKAPEPSRNAAPSFAQVYAKEQQAKPVERNEPAAKPARDKPDDTRKADDSADRPANDSTGKPSTVADSGNDLPADRDGGKGSGGGSDARDDTVTASDGTQPEDPVIDPLLLMAMSGQIAPPVVEPPAPEVTLPTGLPGVAATTPGTSTLEVDAQADPLQGFAGMQVGLQTTGEGDQVQVATTTTVTTQNSASAGQSFASAMAAFSDKPAETTEAPVDVELPVAELSEQLTQGLGESKSEIRSEVLDSRLNALGQAISQQSALAQRTPALVPGQPVAMNQGGWSEAVVDRVMWLSSQNLKSAEIQLDPQELGRLEVRIHMNQDQTQVTFASPNAGVRDALEGQMHRLRDMFSQQGMNQLDVNVSDQSLNRGWQGQQSNEGGSGRGNGGTSHLGGGGDEEIAVGISEIRSPTASGGRGLVDYYA